jgi:uncharacterized protein YndB with AHSA1/START domain
MPRVVRRRRIAAPAGALWSIVSDPYHLPRWWPRTQRVENVSAGEAKGQRWTQVLETKDGRGIRADFRCVRASNPEHYVYEQQVEDGPFAKFLRSSRTEILLDPNKTTTEVTLITEQQLKGISRMGAFMMRRATKRVLSEALHGLERVAVG